MTITLFCLAFFAILFIIRVKVIETHYGWMIEYMARLNIEYLEDIERMSNQRLLKGEDEDEVLKECHELMSRNLNIIKVFELYPSFVSLTFSLDKWTREQCYPYIQMNFALALDGKEEDIDIDLIK